MKGKHVKFKKRGRKMKLQNYTAKEEKKTYRRLKSSLDDKFQLLDSEMKNPIEVNEGIFSEVSIKNDLSEKLTPRLLRQLTESKTHFSLLLLEMNLKNLTKIQSSSFGHVISGENLLMKSVTGSGKTLGYLIPLVERLLRKSREIRKNDPNSKGLSRKDGSYYFVLSPTRELSTQIYNVLKKVLAPFPYIVPGVFFGGKTMTNEKKSIRKGLSIIVCTPARLQYHLENTASFVYDKLEYIVVDEADVQLDMGHERDIKRILEMIRGRRPPYAPELKFLLISATLNERITSLSKSLSRKEFLFIGNENMNQVPKNLNQFYVKVPQNLRLVVFICMLLSKLNSKDNAKIIVFLSSCLSVDFHFQLLKTLKIDGGKQLFRNTKNFFKLHGNLPQKQRERIFKNFSCCTEKNESSVLFTTDVFSRGINLININYIIQYDSPGNPTDYLHRACRTSRVSNVPGNSILFLMNHEIVYLNLLKRLGLSLNQLKGENILNVLRSVYGEDGQKDVFKLVKRLKGNIESFVERKEELKRMALSSYFSFIKAYSVHSREIKYIFHTKNLDLKKISESFGLKERPKNVRKEEKKVERGKRKLTAETKSQKILNPHKRRKTEKRSIYS